MRLLLTTPVWEEADAVAELLERKGIPVIRPDQHSRSIGVVGGRVVALWVALDGQYEDARRILQDPDHEPAEPVDVAAFHAFLDEGRAKGVMFLPSFDQFMTFVLTLAILGFGLFVADCILHISWLPW